MNISTPALIYMIVVLAFVFLLYEKGKKKYEPYCKALSKEEYPLKDFMVIGYALMELLHYGYSGNIDRKLRMQLREVKERDFVEFYLRSTWAMGATYFVIGIFFSALLAVADMELMYVVILVALSFLLFYVPISKLDEEIAKRHLKIKLDLPDFTNKLLILSGAGLSLKAAIIKVSKEMHKETEFYNALSRSVYLMENGTTFEQSLDILVEQCNVPEVRRLVSVLNQNMHHGGADVLLALREISNELWNTRRATAKQLAEQAGTKLLFPMMLMLLAVIAVVAAPALMTLSL